MRFASLALPTFALSLMPLCAQSSDVNLREEIRRIVREEIRAALKETHSTPTVEFFTKGDDGLPSELVQVVQRAVTQKAATQQAKAKTPTADGDHKAMKLRVVDVEGKPIATQLIETKGTTMLNGKVLDGKSLDGRALDHGGAFQLFTGTTQGEGKAKVMVVSPDQAGRTITFKTSEGSPIECAIECKVECCTETAKKGEAECCEAAKAVAECCEAVEKCCEACAACGEKGEKGEQNGECAECEVTVLDDVTVEKKAKKAAKKDKKKKAKKGSSNGAM